MLSICEVRKSSYDEEEELEVQLRKIAEPRSGNASRRHHRNGGIAVICQLLNAANVDKTHFALSAAAELPMPSNLRRGGFGQTGCRQLQQALTQGFAVLIPDERHQQLRENLNI
eukprot:gnl/TRDRNA2_/TRDRNA2_77212_c1_seq1.p1 gnl/TRDRNA2_/TRDRNA2_77212_c1~~gnl/TRDRNA2_/TRDRNA2_77212_c1_seq1.p1  ORF type:complete len:114 (-),score=14.83 gnl/TRDRNA2_/TRDRNA2_77212_c1_seq1:280-621(-)